MAYVQIKCANSGLWVPVGMQVDAAAWESMEVPAGSVTCSICGQVHTWSKREARLVSWPVS
jgi:hypothetical protein